MVGYASSADTHLGCNEITIKVFLSEYLPDEDSDSFELYSVNRSFTRVRKLIGADDNFSLPYQLLIKIAQLLHCEEIKNRCACRIRWRSSDVSYVEKTKTEFLETVWLPTPIFVDHCAGKCINVTSAFFSTAPKPLEASVVCDALNLIFAHTKLNLPHSFFNCMNSVYCSVEMLEVLMYIFRDFDLFSCCGIKPLDIPDISLHRINVKKEILAPLKSLGFEASSHIGSCQSLVTDAKRECISSVCKDLLICIESKRSWQSFLSSFLHHIYAFCDKLISLSGVFMAGENINSISDVWYLTLYELFAAFAFFDSRLNLKATVAHNRLRQRILNKLNPPPLLDAVTNI